MINRFFTVEVTPTIKASDQTAVFSDNDVLFDWTSFQVPKGASRLICASIVQRGANGGAAVIKDIDLIFAKTIDGVGPDTLGQPNAAATALPAISNHVIGITHIDSAGDHGGKGISYWTVASTGSGGSNSLIPSLVLEGEPESGDNVGYDTLYVGALVTENLLDLGTTVIKQGALGAGASTTIPTDAGSDDDPNAELVFAPGDVIHSATDDVLGTISSISAFDTDHQDIILTAANVAAIADNEEIFNINPIRLILSFEK
tara:strand:+ start:22 stop:798 length:777 start_codon:yes stop_codon:yes gene_type:complete